MKIAIDGNEANVLQQVGVSVYTLNLLNYFQQSANTHLQFQVYLREKPLERLPKETRDFTYQIVQTPLLWSQVFLPLYLMIHQKNDVFFTPAHYAPRHTFCPTVVTIHDLSYFYYPEEFLKEDLYKLKNWTQYSMQKASKIIAVSKATKKDILRFYPEIPDHKVTVIYNGFGKSTIAHTSTELFSNIKSLHPLKLLKKQRYLLHVGTIQPRKNITLLVQAFAKIKSHIPDFKLVLVGKKGWLYDKTFQLVADLGLEKDIIFAGYLSDHEVNHLYKNAFCYVLPSLYEGFGIPILEAMAHSCPVISSFTSSLPEVGDEACLYFDPQNIDDLASRIIELYKNPLLRDSLIQKGRERTKLFSWKKCAAETLEIIKSCV